MVSTRRSTLGHSVPQDENRIIVVVTGANSGFGLGICQQLLTNLSLPPTCPIPIATPQRSALPPHLRAIQERQLQPKATISETDPPVLTLILACRSQKKAEEAKEILMGRHEKELRAREKRGEEVRKGWREGLKIVWEGVDLDAVEGHLGILAFCERLKVTYPHITTLFLNAGLGAYKRNDHLRFMWQILTQGFVGPVTHATFSEEYPGVMSADGQRGQVWGVNVLAPYIMAKELAPLLRQSPSTLPFAPRIIYTSSCTATFSSLKPNPLDDYQLLTYGGDWNYSVYKASKYMGDVTMLQLDRQFAKEAAAGEREVRVLLGDPGCVATNIAVGTFGTIGWIVRMMQFFHGLSFWLARLLGSTLHPIYATEGVLPILYAALVAETFIQPAEKVPAQKFKVHSRRFGGSTVDYGEVDRWEESLDVGEGMVRACEAVRVESRRNEGLE